MGHPQISRSVYTVHKIVRRRRRHGRPTIDGALVVCGGGEPVTTVDEDNGKLIDRCT